MIDELIALALDAAATRYGKRNQNNDTDFANGWRIASGGLKWH